jgi:hypothetical protein
MLHSIVGTLKVLGWDYRNLKCKEEQFEIEYIKNVTASVV